MPTYEYKCAACGHTFEKFQSITAPAIKDCPACGRKKVKRLIGTGAGLIFKGSGFYITDYRSDGYKSAAKSEKSTSSSGSGSGSSEAAPASSSASSGAKTSGAPSKGVAKPAAAPTKAG